VGINDEWNEIKSSSAPWSDLLFEHGDYFI